MIADEFVMPQRAFVMGGRIFDVLPIRNFIFQLNNI